MKKTKNKRMSKRTNERMNEPNHIVSNYKNCLIDLFVYISPYRRWNMMESVVMPKYIHIRVQFDDGDFALTVTLVLTIRVSTSARSLSRIHCTVTGRYRKHA